MKACPYNSRQAFFSLPWGILHMQNTVCEASMQYEMYVLWRRFIKVLDFW